MPDNDAAPCTTRCGYVALAGRPNVGKSTLMNRLIGQRLSIVSSRPQTTRHRVLGIRSEGDSQILLLDTPGVHETYKHRLNRTMNRAAFSAVEEADVLLFLVDARQWTEEDQQVLNRVAKLSMPIGLVLNKIDLITRREQLLPLLAELSQKHDFAFVIPLAARRGSNVEALVKEINQRLPVAPFMFPEDQVTDRSERFFAAEIIREKLFELLNQELPHAVTVEVERFAEAETPDGGRDIQIDALIWVARKSQKPIVMGKRNESIKRLRKRAEDALARQMQARVTLEVWVKVRENWTDDAKSLRAFGLDE